MCTTKQDLHELINLIDDKHNQSVYNLLQKQAKFFKKIFAVLNKLQAEPYNMPNVKRIKGIDPETYRYRLGDFRIIYRTLKDELIILILDIGSRGNIYKSILKESQTGLNISCSASSLVS